MTSVFFTKNAATRRYHRRFFPAMALYIVFVFSASWAFPRYHPVGIAAYLLAVLPAIPIVAVIIIVGLYLADEKDEFQRAFLVQSMIWSIGATLSVTTIWGFLELFAKAPHLPPFLIFPLFWFFVGLATPLLKLRYR